MARTRPTDWGAVIGSMLQGIAGFQQRKQMNADRDRDFQFRQQAHDDMLAQRDEERQQAQRSLQAQVAGQIAQRYPNVSPSFYDRIARLGMGQETLGSGGVADFGEEALARNANTMSPGSASVPPGRPLSSLTEGFYKDTPTYQGAASMVAGANALTPGTARPPQMLGTLGPDRFTLERQQAQRKAAIAGLVHRLQPYYESAVNAGDTELAGSVNELLGGLDAGGVSPSEAQARMQALIPRFHARDEAARALREKQLAEETANREALRKEAEARLKSTEDGRLQVHADRLADNIRQAKSPRDRMEAIRAQRAFAAKNAGLGLLPFGGSDFDETPRDVLGTTNAPAEALQAAGQLPGLGALGIAAAGVPAVPTTRKETPEEVQSRLLEVAGKDLEDPKEQRKHLLEANRALFRLLQPNSWTRLDAATRAGVLERVNDLGEKLGTGPVLPSNFKMSDLTPHEQQQLELGRQRAAETKRHNQVEEQHANTMESLQRLREQRLNGGTGGPTSFAQEKELRIRAQGLIGQYRRDISEMDKRAKAEGRDLNEREQLQYGSLHAKINDLTQQLEALGEKAANRVEGAAPAAGTPAAGAAPSGKKAITYQGRTYPSTTFNELLQVFSSLTDRSGKRIYNPEAARRKAMNLWNAGQ